jgi:uncharacterized membrane protein
MTSSANRTKRLRRVAIALWVASGLLIPVAVPLIATGHFPDFAIRLSFIAAAMLPVAGFGLWWRSDPYYDRSRWNAAVDDDEAG